METRRGQNHKKVENHKMWKPKQVGITIGVNQNRWKPEYMEMRRG